MQRFINGFMMLLLVLYRLCPLSAQDRPPHQCGTDQYYAIQNKDGILDRIRLLNDDRLQNWIQSKKQKGNLLQTQTTYVIPVVVHVVYKNATELFCGCCSQ